MTVEPAAYAHNLRLSLPDGDAGVVSTLWVMRACVDDAVESGGPVVRLATRIAAQAGKGTARQVRAVYDFLRRAVVFKRDAVALEHVRHPDQLALEIDAQGRTAGDCDDVATLGAALLRAMGVRPALVLASVRESGAFHHVLFAADVAGRWVMLDPQEGFYDALPPLTRSYLLPW
jgi:transglutaminase-like putative cysteine protease